MKSKIRILWAVDPIDFDLDSLHEVEQLLRVSKGAIHVDPVYIFSPDDLQIDGDLFKASGCCFKKGAELKLQRLLSPLLKEKLVNSPKVLSHKAKGLEESVDVFLEYSKKTKSDFVLLGVTKKKDADTRAFGSFSRTLLSRSDMPSIAVGLSKNTEVDKAPKVIFATDLSHSSLLDLIKFSFLSKKLGSELTFIQKGHYQDDKASKLRMSHFAHLVKRCGVKATYVELASKNPSADELASFAAKNHYSFMGLSCSVLNSI